MRIAACKGLFWLGLLLTLTVFEAPTHADFFVHHWEDQYAEESRLILAPELSFYTSTANYDPAGKSTQVTGMDRYSRYNVDLLVDLGLFEKVSLFGRLAYSDALIYPAAGSTSTATLNTFGLADQTLGIDFRILGKGDFKIDLQAQVDFPGYSNPATNPTGAPFLGDGSLDVTGGAFGSIKVEHWLFRGGAGYTYRNSDFSGAVPWSFLVFYLPEGKGFHLSGGVLGLQTLSTDPNYGKTSSPRTAVIPAGGSFYSYAVDPTLVSGRLQLGYQASNDLLFYGKGEKSFVGFSAPEGWTAAIGMVWNVGISAETSSKNPAKINPSIYGKSNRGLLNYGLEAKVLRMNDRLNLIKIDKGSMDGVEVGQIFDVFKSKAGIAVEAVARTRVTNVKPSQSALKVEEYYKEGWVDEGFIAKQLLE